MELNALKEKRPNVVAKSVSVEHAFECVLGLYSGGKFIDLSNSFSTRIDKRSEIWFCLKHICLILKRIYIFMLIFAIHSIQFNLYLDQVIQTFLQGVAQRCVSIDFVTHFDCVLFRINNLTGSELE